MKASSVNNIEQIINIYPKTLNFRSEQLAATKPTKQDEFIKKKNKSNNTILWIIGSLAIAGLGAFLTYKANWSEKAKGKVDDIVGNGTIFTKVDEAKKYFEDLGIDTIFSDVKKEHLPMLNRIKDDISKLKKMGVKFDKPNTLTISDWAKDTEYEEFCAKKGISVERREGFYAFCMGDKNGANHVFVNTKKPESDVFRHEMGHANHHRGHDSFWESKGVTNHDFADKQLSILGEDIKVIKNHKVYGKDMNNIFFFSMKNDSTKCMFPTDKGETRFVYIKNILEKMQKETNCYAPDELSEQVAYVFDGLIKGEKQFSDEVMLYYDFAGGPRIPNLKINGKTYDEYIKTLYNNRELIQKLKDNIKISKI